MVHRVLGYRSVGVAPQNAGEAKRPAAHERDVGSRLRMRTVYADVESHAGDNCCLAIARNKRIQLREPPTALCELALPSRRWHST